MEFVFFNYPTMDWNTLAWQETNFEQSIRKRDQRDLKWESPLEMLYVQVVSRMARPWQSCDVISVNQKWEEEIIQEAAKQKLIINNQPIKLI